MLATILNVLSLYFTQLDSQSPLNIEGLVLTNLTESLTGKSAVGASGGFAASSNIRDFEKKARDVYGKDIAGVIGSTKRQAQTSFDKIQEIVNQWRQTAQAI